MVSRWSGRPTWVLTVAAFLVLLGVEFAFAQGGVRGVVLDEGGKPVEAATVEIVATRTSQKFQVKTNRNGEFLQIGLALGPYSLTAKKDKLESKPRTVTVAMGTPAGVELLLSSSSAGSLAELEKMTAELKKSFDEGVVASTAGRYDEAILKFNETLKISPNCADCYNNIGYIHTQRKEYDLAEASYKKAIEVKPDDATGYSGLANVYNAQRKFDLAAQASAKATELSGGATPGAAGGDADTLFNQGVIFWNGGKIADAKAAFEGAIKANPAHAEAHYQLGMVLVNEGNLAAAATELEEYLKLTPDGPQAPTAKALLGQIKK